MLPAAYKALEWIDKYGDLDGDGFLEYKRRSPQGLVNQAWKDSWDANLHRDGSVAEPPIAPVEVQGYVYDAKYRMASLLRSFGDSATADRLKRDCAELAKRFDKAYWMPEHGFYAMALDNGKAASGDCLQRRAPALEPHHQSRTGAHRCPATDARRHLFRVGMAHHVQPRACFQSPQLPSRLGVAARQFAYRSRHGPQRKPRSRAARAEFVVPGGAAISATTDCPSFSAASSAGITMTQSTIRFLVRRRRGLPARCF